MAETLSFYRIDTTNNNKIDLEIGNRSVRISGAAKVIQEIVRLLLQTPGSDEDAPGQGADLKSLVNRQVLDNGQSTQLDIVGAIRKTLRDIRANQTGHDLPGNERLANLEALDVRYNRSEHRWLVNVRVVLEDGTNIVVDFAKLLKPLGSTLFGN